MINNNQDKSTLVENNYVEEKKNNYDVDLTIKTGTTKSEIIDLKNDNKNLNSNENIKINEFEHDKIISAQNNDLNKANNILKQIRRRANFVRKM